MISVFISFLPFISALLLDLSLSWKRGLLLFPITLAFIHVGTRWRWQLVPAYLVVLGLILFGLWAVFPAVNRIVPLPAGRSLRWTIIAIKANLSVALIGAAIFLTWAFPEIDFPTTTGPYAVGTTSETIENVSLRLWYPAASQSQSQSEAQSAVTPYRYLEDVQIPGVPDFLYSHLQGRETVASADVPVASNFANPQQRSFPVVLYDHGANSFREDNTFRLMELASHGFVVAAITHPKPFENYGITAQLAQDPALFNQRLASLVVPERVKDVRLAVQQLEQLNAQAGRFQSKFSLDSLGLLGYSLGGSVLSEYCLEDTRCTAIVNLDGGSFGEARQGVEAAYLQLSQSVALPSNPVEDPQSVMEKTSAYYRQEVSDLLRHTQITHPTHWLQIKGSGHAAFTDFVHWTPMRVGFFRVLLGTGDVDAIAQTINDLTRVFLSEHLRSEPNSEFGSKFNLETTIRQHSKLLETLSG